MGLARETLKTHHPNREVIPVNCDMRANKRDQDTELTDDDLVKVVGGAGGVDRNQDPPPK